MHKQIVAYSCNRILLTNIKEWTVDIHGNIDEFQNIFAEWKKPEYILCESNCIEILENVN